MHGAIFDLDGTLADTAADLLAAANAALAEVDLPTLDYRSERQVAGRGGRAMIRRAIVLAGRDPDASPEQALTDELYPKLLIAYEARIADQTILFEGVEDCLDRLAADGWRLGICTNKPERLARILMTKLGVLDRFGALLGADTLAVRKPDPLHFTQTCSQIGADPAMSVMIGDTSTDLLTARAVGCPCILTRFGFAAEPLESLAPDAIVEHYEEMPGVLETLTADRVAS
ncbi:MAG: phosphoglycolate phosphatase [Pseudomonadota bacterium]